MTFLTDDPLSEAKKLAREAFLVFEHKEGSKVVDEREIPTVIRSIGINPTAMQMEKFTEKLKEESEESSNYVTLETFEKVLPSLLVTDIEQLMRDDFHRILSAFHALDPEGNGYIPADTMKRLMSENGEPMSEEEINIMMAACCDDDGKICYENYAYLLAGDGRNI